MKKLIVIIILMMCGCRLNGTDINKEKKAEEIIDKMEKVLYEGKTDEKKIEEFYKLVKELKKIGKPALNPIWDEANSTKDEEFKMMLLQIYGEILEKTRNPRYVARLIKLLDDKKQPFYKRAQAADTLGDIGGKGVFDALVRNLNDPDDSVRGSCARALGYLGDRRAGDYLIPLVEDESEFVRRCARGALVLLKDERAFDILLKEMEKVKGDELKLRSVINCFGRLGDRRAIPYLIEFTEEKYPKFVRTSAMKSLAMFGKEDKRVVEVLIKLLKDGDGYIVLWAGRELAEMDCKEAIKPIEEAIKRATDEVAKEDLKKSYKKLTGKEYIE